MTLIDADGTPHVLDVASPLSLRIPSLLDPEVATADPTVALDRSEPEVARRDGLVTLSVDVRLALLDAMPVAVFLIDEQGDIRFSNVRIADMIGLTRDELFGRSVFDFVMVEDLDFAADLFNHGTEYGQQLMGPSRIRYVDACGLPHWTQVWAQAAPPELGGGGYIVSLTSESTRDVLASAVSSVAADDALDNTLSAIALSVRALPFGGRGAILAVEPAASDDESRFRLIGEWPIDLAAINAFGTPWRRALVDGVASDVGDVAAFGLAPAARDMLLSVGIASVFVRPILDVAGDVTGVLVVFRTECGGASANQDDHLDDATRLAGLAFGQKRRRLELETAAHRDALTGIANRAAFNERLRVERRTVDVFFIDLDHFKSVNDTFGHHVGDQVIAHAARRIESAIRREDTVYRTGGDEFVVISESSGESTTTRVELAERIIEQLMAPFDVDLHRVRIGATIGIAAAGERSVTDTVRAADKALYTAKERGRSGWAHADDQ